MKIGLLSGIVQNPRNFAPKKSLFNNNKKPSQFFLKLTILFQIKINNNPTFLGSLDIVDRDCALIFFFL